MPMCLHCPPNPPPKKKTLGTLHSTELWTNDPTISVPILKMMTEFVTNKNSRLQMSTSSQNGILLFRQTSAMLVKYGEQIGQMGEYHFLSAKPTQTDDGLLQPVGTCKADVCECTANVDGAFQVNLILPGYTHTSTRGLQCALPC